MINVEIETEVITKLEFVTLDKVYAREYRVGDMYVGDDFDYVVAVGTSEAFGEHRQSILCALPTPYCGRALRYLEFCFANFM